MKYNYKVYKPLSKEELKLILTEQQYAITQAEGTEPPFNNAYHDNKAVGIYVDIVSKEPLFSSLDKYDSGTGWPSFSRPLPGVEVIFREDHKLFVKRVEVISKLAGSHLGHVFDDGPAPTGKRYCMNSGSLEFIPLEKMEEYGYAEFLPLFNGTGKAVEDKEASEASGCIIEK